MKKVFLLILFITTLSFSQERKVTVIDSETKKPVQYVNIKYLGSNDGTFSDETGVFHLDKNTKDSILISVIGYNNKVLWSEKITDTITLKSKSVLLEEVVLNSKKKDYGLYKKKSKFIFSLLEKIVIATYIPNKNKDVEEYISTLHYRIKKRRNKTSIVRPHLYTLDEKSGQPDKELLDKNIIIKINTKNRILSVDISDRNIIFPKNGIFVALEWVGNTTDVGIGHSKLNDAKDTFAFITSLDPKKQIWKHLIWGHMTTNKGDKAIVHFGFTTRVKE